MANFPKPGPTHTSIEPRAVIPDGVWVKCAGCQEALFARELARHGQVCHVCGHHGVISARERLDYLLDPDSFQSLPDLRSAVGGTGRIDDISAAFAAVDATTVERTAPAEAVVAIRRVVELAVTRQLPCVVFAAAGLGIADAGEVVAERARLHLVAGKLAAQRLASILVVTDTNSDSGVALPMGDVVLCEARATAYDEDGASEMRASFIDLFVPRTELSAELAKLLAFFVHTGSGDGERSA